MQVAVYIRLPKESPGLFLPFDAGSLVDDLSTIAADALRKRGL